MHLIIILILLAIVIAIFRRVDAFVFFVAIVDIFLRIIAFIQTQVPDPEVASILNRYFPDNIPAIVYPYTDGGIIYTVFMWIFVIIYIIFEYYIIRSFLKRR